MSLNAYNTNIKHLVTRSAPLVLGPPPGINPDHARHHRRGLTKRVHITMVTRGQRAYACWERCVVSNWQTKAVWMVHCSVQTCVFGQYARRDDQYTRAYIASLIKQGRGCSLPPDL